MTSNPIVTLFYRRLLELDTNPNIEPVLQAALDLLVQVTSASAGCVELFNERREPHYCRARGFNDDELVAVRGLISCGVIAHAVAEGRTVATSSTALVTSAVTATPGTSIICAPIADTSIGVVYLQGGRGGRAFTALDIEHTELFARRIAPIAGALIPPQSLEVQISAFKRQLIRQELRRNNWNMTLTARSLGMGRAALYRALRSK